jgi:signal transduction histidine kinase
MSKSRDNLSWALSPLARFGSLLELGWGALARLPQRVLHLVRSNLRAKFMVLIVSLEIALMGAVTFVVESHQRQAIFEQARLRALSLGANLAALSEGYLLSYDFVKLEQGVERVTTNEADVDYAVAHLRNGKVAAFSGRSDLQGRTLTDPVSQQAVAAEAPLVQQIIVPQSGKPGYDIAIPVFAQGSPQKWGTIRLGFSLERAHVAIQKTRRDLLLLGCAAVVCGTMLAIFLAKRISKPVDQLVVRVHQFAEGAYDRPIQVDTRDEIGYLAQAFEQMRQALQRHLAYLAEEKRLLEETNHRLQATQQQLVQSERLAAVGKLAAKVAHEVNNPLAIIKSAIHFLRRQSRKDDPASGHLEVIEEEISRIARILRDLLDISRPSPTAQPVEVNALIQSLERLLRPNLDAKRIALTVVLDPAVPQVQIPPDHLKQVLLNLVRNAEDAMPDGGHLTMQTVRTADGVEVHISDTGCGIPAEHLPHLFEPFFTTKAQQGGMGLGLSVLDGILNSAHGRIEVESAVGKGSTFRVFLPACTADEISPAAAV